MNVISFDDVFRCYIKPDISTKYNNKDLEINKIRFLKIKEKKIQ
jgi:hypothetical protein